MNYDKTKDQFPKNNLNLYQQYIKCQKQKRQKKLKYTQSKKLSKQL